ncbi:protein of unknown function [Streptomyces sp. KY75]|nr:protein of unknown function [Streptomyces sp. KY75]CAD5994852.1 protein of unknown function [Streptomyces sp. KY70]
MSGGGCTKRSCTAWTTPACSSRAVLDAAHVRAKEGGELTGPSPVDRGKPGSKMHVLSDANGLPLLVGFSAANTHDSLALKPMVQGHQTRHDPHCGRYFKSQRLHADRADDVPHLRKLLRASTSASASPARELSTANGWAAADGSSSGPCPGSPATADSTTVTSGNQATTWPFSDWQPLSATTKASSN